MIQREMLASVKPRTQHEDTLSRDTKITAVNVFSKLVLSLTAGSRQRGEENPRSVPAAVPNHTFMQHIGHVSTTIYCTNGTKWTMIRALHMDDNIMMIVTTASGVR